MAKQVMHSANARQSVLDGVTKLASVVRVTMGPTGKNVILQKSFGAPRVYIMSMSPEGMGDMDMM